jgi:4-amino-4-deoxy-L-arabinose transferase-like glycosyltransferase
MSLSNRRFALLVLVVVALAHSFFMLGDRTLWTPDEGRYAEIGREMLESGDYVTPRLNYVRYFEKPPLTYWATALSLSTFGLNEWAARMPVAAAGFLGILITFYLGEAVAGTRAGFLSAAILATCPLYYGVSRFIVLDGPLTTLVALAIYLLFRCMVTERAAYGRWGAAALGAATLVKGPIAVVMAGFALGPALLLHYRDRILRYPWVSMAIIYLAVVTPWFVAIGRVHPEFLHFFFIHEHLDRYLKPEHHRPGKPWYFVPVLLLGAFPWSSLFPFLPRWTPRKPEATVLWSWALLPVLFFSFSKSKLPAYILPSFPPLAVLVGWLLDRVWTWPVDKEKPSPRPRVELGPWFMAIFAGLAAALSYANDPEHTDVERIRQPVRYFTLAVATVGVWNGFLMNRGRLATAFWTTVTVMILLLGGGNFVCRKYQPEKDTKAFADAIRAHRRDRETVVIYGMLELASALPFYLQEPVIVTGYHFGELTMAHDAPEPYEEGRFLSAQAAERLMRRDMRRVFVLTPRGVFDDYFNTRPYNTLKPIRRAGDLILFTNQ